MANFDWFTKYRVSCDWACHRKRGSNGGEDRVHPAGSPVLAPYDCVVTYGKYSDDASYVQFKYDNGYAHRALHIQNNGRVADGTRVSEGTRVAYSDGRRGTFGAGTSTGPHVHFQGHKNDSAQTRIPWADVPEPYKSSKPAQNINTETDADMPINFRNPANGYTYTMIPGIMLQAHSNAFGSRLTNYINTGVWPASESDEDRFNAGLRDLNKDHVNWMLSFYGFGRFNADTLPTSGVVYSDVMQAILQNKSGGSTATVDYEKLANVVSDNIAKRMQN